MAAIATQAKTRHEIREQALEIVALLPGKDFSGEIIAVFNWVRRNIRYTRDIKNVETLQTPQKTLQYGQGDCDDHAILLASLLESLGHDVRFVAVGFMPRHYEHVFAEVLTPQGWLALDTTEPQPLGWRPPNPRAVMVEAIE